MTEERFQEFLRAEARDYNEPPETPREEMWRGIQAERAEREGRRWPERWHHRAVRSPWVRWSVGIAAALVVGIGIGRFSGQGMPGGTQMVADSTEREAESAPSPYRWVAAEHLGQVETFLTGFQVDARAGVPVQYTAGPAKQLLSTTRLLLDSPASEDAQMRTLLEDVELVLAQIAQLQGGQGEAGEEELELIDDSIDQRSVLLRLQTAMTAEARVAGGQGAL